MTKKFYTGVGSRATPDHILESITTIARSLSKAGWYLRSGGAEGADSAFEAGAGKRASIYLPWTRFNDHRSPLDRPPECAFEIAASIHLAWHRLSPGACRLHARNVQQVLGDCPSEPVPSKFLICWTHRGEVKGGTATAINLAQQNQIPVVNLGLGIKSLRCGGLPLPAGVRDIIRTALGKKK